MIYFPNVLLLQSHKSFLSFGRLLLDDIIAIGCCLDATSYADIYCLGRNGCPSDAVGADTLRPHTGPIVIYIA